MRITAVWNKVIMQILVIIIMIIIIIIITQRSSVVVYQWLYNVAMVCRPGNIHEQLYNVYRATSVNYLNYSNVCLKV